MIPNWGGVRENISAYAHYFHRPYLESGAKGSGRPIGSGIICVPKSCRLWKAGSERIVPERVTVRRVRSVLTRLWSAEFAAPAAVSVVRTAEEDGAPDDAYQKNPATITPIPRSIHLLCDRNDIVFTEARRS